MLAVGKYQLEVTQIVIRKNELMNKRFIDTFKRTVFINEIESVSEYTYRVEQNYNQCSVLIMRSGEWIKVKDDYLELRNFINEWNETNTQEPIAPSAN